jgi:hypothetical protein
MPRRENEQRIWNLLDHQTEGIQDHHLIFVVGYAPRDNARTRAIDDAAQYGFAPLSLRAPLLANDSVAAEFCQSRACGPALRSRDQALPHVFVLHRDQVIRRR